MNLLKRAFPHVLLILICVTVGFIIASIIFAATGSSLFRRTPGKTVTSADLSNAELTSLAFGVLEYIRDGDYLAMSSIVHPDYGVVISPSATVSLSTNRRFTAEQVALFENDTNVYFWGVQDGSGEPIEISPAAYFDEYILSKDYSSAPLIGVNKIVRSGNALENIEEEFPGVKYVDFHIPGVERDNPDELDWSSVRIGFEDHEGLLWLTVIISSRWTT